MLPMPAATLAVRYFMVALLAGLLFHAGPLRARPAGNLGEAWRAWQAAVQGNAPPDELLPLARAVHDALPKSPKTPKQMHAKAVAALNLGGVLRDLRQWKEARRRFHESVVLFTKALGPSAPELVDPLWEEARAADRAARAKPGEVFALYERIDGILALQGQEAVPQRIRLHVEFAEVAYRREHLDLARRQVARVRAIIARQAAHDYMMEGRIALLEARIAEREHRFDDVISLHEEALADYRHHLSKTDHEVLRLHRVLARRLESAGRSDEATTHLLAIGRALAAKPKRIAVVGDYMPVYRAPIRMRPSAFGRKYRQGRVVVTFTVTREGRVRDIRITESSPPGVFDKAVIEAVRRFRYAPRFRDGEPVDTPGVTYTWEFRMEG
ncbi:MAG: energy transducer TonB [Alphaproteobacteria bacterium]|nr:MAG: energy transducer TonB [Alphaproteobacteria bacterium]